MTLWRNTHEMGSCPLIMPMPPAITPGIISCLPLAAAGTHPGAANGGNKLVAGGCALLPGVAHIVDGTPGAAAAGMTAVPGGGGIHGLNAPIGFAGIGMAGPFGIAKACCTVGGAAAWLNPGAACGTVEVATGC